jgi:hypothetical protein
MSLAADVQEQIRRYIAGLISADDLSDWLDARAEEVGNRSDESAREVLAAQMATTERVTVVISSYVQVASVTGTAGTLTISPSSAFAWAPTANNVGAHAG